MPASADRKHYCSRCLTTFSEDVDQCPNLACQRKKPSRGWGVLFAEGDLFDRTYRIHKMLAVGGAGVTYVGRELDGDNEEYGPRIAIKVLLAARDQGPYVRRLATEAQIIQELDHPNMVQYLGFVHRAGHSPYLLTRFEAGGSLLDHMRRVGTLSVKQAALVGRQLCWALEKAHERDIVHRDLKPENVLLTRPVAVDEDPVIRVADFGIAKVQGSLGSNLTRVGAFVGTPHYAAPEQFVGGTVTKAADVYGVGALLYFTMTAKHVVRFADRIDPEDGFQLLCDNLPPRLERPADPPDAVRRMQTVLAAAMKVDPLARCTVVELDEMLQAVAADHEPQSPVRPAPESAVGDVAPGASVLGVAAAAASRPLPAGTPAPSEPAPPPPIVPTASPASPAILAANLAAAAAEEPTTDDESQSHPRSQIERTSPTSDAPSGGRSWAVIAFLTMVVVGGGAVLLAGSGFGILAYLQPALVEEYTGLDLPGSDGPAALPDAPELVADTKANERDLHVVRASLEQYRSKVRKVCKAERGETAAVTVVVDGSGTVLGATSTQRFGSCAAKVLTGRTLERVASRTVRVTYDFVW